jgi:hypothetical protein
MFEYVMKQPTTEKGRRVGIIGVIMVVGDGLSIRQLRQIRNRSSNMRHSQTVL